jgi:hypothetical protein
VVTSYLYGIVDPKDGGSRFFRNVSTNLPENTESHLVWPWPCTNEKTNTRNTVATERSVKIIAKIMRNNGQHQDWMKIYKGQTGQKNKRDKLIKFKNDRLHRLFS